MTTKKFFTFILISFLSISTSHAQELVYDKTTDGIRLVATSETICRSFTDRLVLGISLEAIIDEERSDTTFAIESHITSSSRLEVTKDSPMRLTLNDGSAITLPVLKEDWEIVRDIHLVNGAVLTSYDIVPLFSVTQDQIKAISKGVKHVSINVYLHMLANNLKLKEAVCKCAIGDKTVIINGEDLPYKKITSEALSYIMDSIGGFEKLAEWGLIRM